MRLKIGGWTIDLYQGPRLPMVATGGCLIARLT